MVAYAPPSDTPIMPEEVDVHAGEPAYLQRPSARAQPGPSEFRQAAPRRAASDWGDAVPPASGAYYRNCTEARAAGATPLYAGDPGYGTHMDGDGDGVACEPYRGRR